MEGGVLVAKQRDGRVRGAYTLQPGETVEE